LRTRTKPARKIKLLLKLAMKLKIAAPLTNKARHVRGKVVQGVFSVNAMDERFSELATTTEPLALTPHWISRMPISSCPLLAKADADHSSELVTQVARRLSLAD
jgi:hypothetical protein